jgi:hypothetical protein
MLSWNTTPICDRNDSRLTLRMSMPSIVTLPECGSQSRCSSAMAVDFPAPVSPTRATVCPGSAVKETSLRIGGPPG